MKKFIVTGANGYLGLEICRKLADQGLETLAVIRQAPSEAMRSLRGINFIIKDISKLDSSYIPGDLRDYILIDCAWENGFNHSWEGHSKVAYEHDLFLRGLAKAGLTRIVGIGSMHEYGKLAGQVFEGSPTEPVNEYGRAKVALEQRLVVLSKTFGTSVLWVRCFYFFGSDERNKSLWTKIQIADKEGQEKFSLDAAKSKFDFLEVGEAAKMIIKLAKSIHEGQVNLGSGNPMELRSFLIQFVEKNKIDIELEFSNSNNGFEGIWPDVEKLNELLEG